MTDEDKQWFSAQLGRVEEKMASLETRLEQKMASLEMRLEEKIERVETTLLTEFHKWASPNEMRQRTHAAAIRTLDMEMESMSERVTKLEQR